MGGSEDFLSGGGGASTSTSPAGGGSADFLKTPATPTKKKKKKGLLGKTFGVAGKGLGFVGGALGGLQQATFRGGSALREAIQGDEKSALQEAGKGLLEIASLGQAKGDISFEEATVRPKQREAFRRGEVKSPLEKTFGRTGATVVGTTGDFLIDPLIVFGAGAKAARGVSQLSKLSGLSKPVIKRIIKKEGLQEGPKALLRTKLISGGMSPKRAEKIVKKTAKKGHRGVLASVAGEKIGSGAKLAAGTRAGQTALKPLRKAGDLTLAVRPRAALAKALGSGTRADMIRRSGGRASAVSASKLDNIMNEVANAVKASEEKLKRAVTREDDSKIAKALEEGPDAVRALKEEAPGLSPLVDTLDRARKTLTHRQVEAGVLGRSGDAIRAAATAKATKHGAKVTELRDAATKLRRQSSLARQQARTLLKKTERAKTSGKITAAEARTRRSRATALDNEARSLARKAQELEVKARKPAKKLRKAEKTLETVQEGVSGVRHEDYYLHRIFTPEAREALKRAPAHIRQAMGDLAEHIDSALDQAAAKTRSIFPDLSAEDLNVLKQKVDEGVDIETFIKNSPESFKALGTSDPVELARMAKEFTALAKAVPKGAQIYKTSAIESILTRAASAEKAIAARGFVDELLDATGERILMTADEVAEKGRVPGWVDVDLGSAGKFHAPKEIANEITKIYGRSTGDEFLKGFQQAMDKWTQFWKAHATVGLLGAMPFAMRNARSNMWLMMTAGGMSPKDVGKYMKEAGALEKKIRKVTGEGKILGKFGGKHAQDVADEGLEAILKRELTPYEFDMYRAMQDNGILRGFFDVDFADTAEAATKKLLGERAVRGGRLGNVVSSKGGVAQTGRRINQAVETNARMAMFMKKMDEVGDVDRAALEVKRVLFDYEDLTAFEKRVMKRIVPFYTFMRKNLALQLETLAKNPIRITLPEKTMRAITEDLPEDAPDYLKEQGARKIPDFVPLVGGRATTPDRPFGAAMDTLAPLFGLLGGAEASEVFGDIMQVPGGPQFGLAKTGLEMATKKDSFTGFTHDANKEEALRRMIKGQVPSTGRLPRRVGPAQPSAILGRSGEKHTTGSEILKFLAGLPTTELE